MKRRPATGVRVLRDRVALRCEPLPPDPRLQRIEFASLVVRRLMEPGARVAVLVDCGRPALVQCGEWLYERLAPDHELVGVYAPGARVQDVLEDLEAAGL